MVEHHEYRLQPEVTVRQYSTFFSSIYVVRSKKGNSNTDVSFPVLAAGSWRCEEYWQKGLWKSVVSWTCILTLNPDGGIQKYTNSSQCQWSMHCWAPELLRIPLTESFMVDLGYGVSWQTRKWWVLQKLQSLQACWLKRTKGTGTYEISLWVSVVFCTGWWLPTLHTNERWATGQG